MKKFLAVIALSGAATLFSAGEALAVPITGALSVGGEVTDLSRTDLTLVDFVGDGAVLGSSGDLTMAFATLVSLTDIVIAAPGQIWSVGGFTFTATSYSLPVLNVSGGKDFVALGTLSAAGFDDTDGRLAFSSDSSGGQASFSSTSSSVPEPATLALVGMGLLGAGFAGRRRKGRA